MKKILAFALSVLRCFAMFTGMVSAQATPLTLTVTGSDETTLTATWQADSLPEGATVEFDEAVIGGVACAVTESENTVVADISELPVGVYTAITYSYTVNADEGSVTVDYRLVKPGSLEVTLDLTVNDDGTITVKATDENGNPVANYALQVTIGSMITQEKTNKNGVFSSRLFAEYGSTVSCIGIETVTDDNIVYLGTEAVEAVRAMPTTTTTTVITTTTESSAETTTTGSSGETTTTLTDTVTTTTTVKPTTTTATKPVNATTVPTDRETIKGAGTTSYSDGKVSVNVSLDKEILTLFGLSEKAFADSGRLLLSEADYKNLIGRTSDVLMLNVLMSDKQATASQISAAVADISEFSKYEEEHRQAVTFDFSFLRLDSSGKLVPITAVPLNSTYVVQLPVPQQMQNCEKLAITLFDGDGLMTPIEVDAKNQIIRLEINSLEPYTLIGFAGEDGQRAGGNSVLLIILLVVGILLLLGAATLLYFFVLRKPDAKVADTEPILTQPQTFDENDIFSGREDFTEINRRPPSDDKE